MSAQSLFKMLYRGKRLAPRCPVKGLKPKVLTTSATAIAVASVVATKLRGRQRRRAGNYHPPFFIMIKFKYNKNIDKACWNRIIQEKEIFGRKVPGSFNIKKRDIRKAREKVKEFQKIWDNNKVEFQKGIKKIYGYYFPEKMVCYINTSPYSMDNFEKNYISVSMYRGTPEKIIGAIIHEASHFMFRKYYTDFCRIIGCNQDNIEQIKEVITVINNIEFKNINDYGWKIHQKSRKKVKKSWKENYNIKRIIKDTLNEIKK